MKGMDKGETSEEVDGLAKLLETRFEAYCSDRQPWESLWEKAWERWNCEFNNDKDATDGTGGRDDSVYGLSRRKVKIFVAHIYDLLFNQGKFPFDLGNTPIPDYAIQREDGSLDKGSIDALDDAERVEGMEDLIKDQLIEGKFKREIHDCLMQGGVFGTMVLEGPMVEERTRTMYEPVPIPQEMVVANEQGQIDPRTITANMDFKLSSYTELSPVYRFRDIWDIYPDMTTPDINEGEGVFVVDEMSEADLAELSTKMNDDGSPKYDAEKIREILNSSEGTKSYSEIERGPHRRIHQESEKHQENRHFIVITYHGKINKKELEPFMDFDEEDGDTDDEIGRPLEDYLPHEVIVTFCNGKVLRVEENDNAKGHRQIKLAPVMRVLGSPFGWGITMEMENPEKIFDTFLRLMVDNKRRAGYVDEVVDGERIENFDELPHFGRRYNLYPGADAAGAVAYIPYPDVSSNILEILRFCEEWGNAASNLPAFLEGDDVQSGNTTAYEVSEQKSSAIKMLGLTMQSIDENLLVPSFEDLYAWNMKYASDPTVKGDFTVEAKGYQSFKDHMVRAREIRQMIVDAGQNEEMQQDIDYRGALKELGRISGAGTESFILDDEQKAQKAQENQQQQQAAIEAQRAALQMQTEARIQEIVAQHKSDVEMMELKHRSDMEALGIKIRADAEKSLLVEESKRLKDAHSISGRGQFSGR